MGRDRRGWVRLWGRDLVGVSVDGSAGGGEDEALDTVEAACLDQADAGEDVYSGVEDGVLDRAADADLGRQLADRVGLLPFYDPVLPSPIHLHLILLEH